jgi:cell division transport system ATP-binding protein
VISLVQVSKVYPPENPALQGINLNLAPGEFLFVAGASGAGKSTFLKLLYGEVQASSGQINVAGYDLRDLRSANVVSLRREIGFVFQDYKLLPNRRIWENVSFGLELRGVPAKERRELAINILSAMNLADRADAFPGALSGGEQQRIAVARALVVKPKLILADEPTGNLDSQMTNTIFDLLLQANAAGVTVVVATHNLSIIETLNLRTMVLEKGQIIGDFAQPGGVK